MARKCVTIPPVVDLRSAPHILLPQDYSHQEGRETQLLRGESLLLIDKEGEWLKVGALQQPRYTALEGWHPYPGWVHQSEVQEVSPEPYSHVVCTPGSLSYGTLVSSESAYTRPLTFQLNREQIVADAKQFVGAPYLWGGRSFTLIPFQIASVDCSGLTNLLYRAQGIYIPRNAHDQYLMSLSVDTLQPADLLYLAKDNYITHVIMKLDTETFIEAPETGKRVRLLKWGTDIWEEEGRVRIFDRPCSYHAHKRSFFKQIRARESVGGSGV